VELLGGLAAVEDLDEVDADEGRADGADGGEAPLADAGAAFDIARNQLAAFSARYSTIAADSATTKPSSSMTGAW
jgi:hypothetical protein